jgi:hypothetical protein
MPVKVRTMKAEQRNGFEPLPIAKALITVIRKRKNYRQRKRFSKDSERGDKWNSKDHLLTSEKLTVDPCDMLVLI